MKSWKATGLLLLALSACSSSDQVAKVGDRSISKREFEAYLKLKNIPSADKDRRALALDAYLQREAMADAVESQKLLDQDALQAEVHEFKKDALINRYFDKFLDEKVTEQAVQNYYTAHANEFEERKVHVAHLLFRIGRATTDTDKAAARTRAEQALTKLRGGADFAKLAESDSEDKISSRRGGDLGWIKEGGVHPTFSAKAFALKPGDVSDVVETPFGYHVIRLIEGPTMVKRPLEAARGDIRYRLREDAKRSESARLMGAVKVERSSSEPTARTTADSSSAQKTADKP